MTRGNITSVGGLLPHDLLNRIDLGDGTLVGLAPTDYGLESGDRVRDAVTRSWKRLAAEWRSFRRAEGHLPRTERTATSLTRDRWLRPLLDEMGFRGLRLVRKLTIDGKTYPVSHQWGTSVPVHLLGSRVPVGRRTPGVAGAAKTAPHHLLQEFLNRSDDHLWGIVSNGLLFRILRENRSLTRAAYIEFDLQGIFDGMAYGDFAILWLVCHRSRFESEDRQPSILEQWFNEGSTAAARARESLRIGVEHAIESLGTGLLSHPANSRLRSRLAAQELAESDFQQQLLRLVYRMLFLLVAEARNLLLAPDTPDSARERYYRFYSMERLCRLARNRRGNAHSDLWQALRVTMNALDVRDHNAQSVAGLALGLTALGSQLWSQESVADIASAQIDNDHLLRAVRSLTFFWDEEAKVLRPVDYYNLGTEEIGSVYESLLELRGEADIHSRQFTWEEVEGGERKTTGSYYTPPDLIARILDDTLDPLIEKASAQSEPQEALLNLKVLDPACGSGHFLIAVAHRIAEALVSVRDPGGDLSPERIRSALREVINRCVYGIDINPMAVEICKVSLWLESNTPGKALGFLDHHILCGNSLLGTTPKLLQDGIPDTAFKPVLDDDKLHASALRRSNKKQRKMPRQSMWVSEWSLSDDTAYLSEAIQYINDSPSDTADHILAKETQYIELVSDERTVKLKLLSDIWCAAFVVNKKLDAPAITEDVLRTLEGMSMTQLREIVSTARGDGFHLQGGVGQLQEAVTVVLSLAEQYQFIHMHLAFPDVFEVPDDPADASNVSTGWSGGFDAVVGNPPFLNQLRGSTVTQRHAANLQATRYEGLTSAYTDMAYLFFALSCEAARSVGGRVGLVQPESLLAANGAGALRREVSSRFTLESLWLAGEKMFSADVLTCAVTLRSGQIDGPSILRRTRGGNFQILPDLNISMLEVSQMPTWGPLIADGIGVPQVRLSTRHRLGDVLSATADFRDQYYGLIPFVVETVDLDTNRGISSVGHDLVPLITVGLIDPLHNRWGESPTRFAKKRWIAPAVDVSRLRTHSDLGTWADRRLVPKLLLATQTKTLEVVADEEGSLLPSVPVITVVPESISLWHAAALLSGPPLTAWAAARHLGASLSTSALKLSARQVEDLPLPAESEAWDLAALHARSAFRADSVHERTIYLRELAFEVCTAYGIDKSSEVIAWWLRRLPRRGSSSPSISCQRV